MKRAFMLAEDAAHAAQFNNIRRVAFTLAEVLITLGVIGIVAALTMPALIGNYKRKQTVTQLKKIYSSMQQSIQMSQAEYGDIQDWDWSQNGQDFFTQYLGKNFNVVKNCGTEQGCWNSTGILTLSGKEYSPNPLKSSGWSSLILSDGVYISLLKQDNNHVHFMIDLNGSKKPDMLGKDIFEMTFTSVAFEDGYHIIAKPGLYFYGFGLPITSLVDNCKKNNTGQYCRALIQYDGWEMRKDYPW